METEVVAAQESRNCSDSYLETLRDQLALFQEGRGIPRGEYSFLTLMAAIVTMICQSVHSLISIMLNLAPIVEVGLHVLRFSLESLVNLKNSTEPKEFAKKTLIFIAQLGFALTFVIFAFGSILYPIFTIGLNVGLRTVGLLTGRRIVL